MANTRIPAYHASICSSSPPTSGTNPHALEHAGCLRQRVSAPPDQQPDEEGNQDAVRRVFIGQPHARRFPKDRRVQDDEGRGDKQQPRATVARLGKQIGKQQRRCIGLRNGGHA